MRARIVRSGPTEDDDDDDETLALPTFVSEAHERLGEIRRGRVNRKQIGAVCERGTLFKSHDFLGVNQSINQCLLLISNIVQ